MKVICVKKPITYGGNLQNPPSPEVGDVDVVVSTLNDGLFDYYVLERFCAEVCFISINFATLPDQPEEVIEEPELATA